MMTILATLEDTLAAEVKRIAAEQHALAVRRAHVESALLRARQGVDERIVRATLESKNVIVLRQAARNPDGRHAS